MLRAMNQYKNAWHEMKMWYNSVAMAYVGLAVTLALAHSCLRKMSVVNRYLQSWEVSNVFVQGACIYPQNPGYNPTDTVGTLILDRAGDPRAVSQASGAISPVTMQSDCERRAVDSNRVKGE
jgi:hypothetical protein